LYKKANVSEKANLRDAIQQIESLQMRGRITEEWITRHVTSRIRWGTRTRARTLAWDLYRLHEEMWAILDKSV
jgi:hypothetical protein